MLGDFNDEPDDASIRDHLRAAKSDDHLPPDSLLDTTAPIKADGKGTIVYKNKWDLLRPRHHFARPVGLRRLPLEKRQHPPHRLPELIFTPQIRQRDPATKPELYEKRLP